MELFSVNTFLTLNMIISATYLIAAPSYRDSGAVVSDDHDLAVGSIMLPVCLINICVWIVGTILIRLRATHIFHVIYLVILMGIVVPILVIWGGRVQASAKSETTIQNNFKDMAIKYWREHHAVLPALEEAQSRMHCCGLEGPADYRAFIYNRDASEGIPCEDEEFDVPYSCVRLQRLHEECKEKQHSKYCKVHSFIREVIVFNDPTARDMMMNKTDSKDRLKYKCDNAHNMSAVTIHDPTDFAIHKEGCVLMLLENIQNLRSFNNIIFAKIFILSFLALAYFMSHWYELLSAEEAEMENIQKLKSDEAGSIPKGDVGSSIPIIDVGRSKAKSDVGRSKPNIGVGRSKAKSDVGRSKPKIDGGRSKPKSFVGRSKPLSRKPTGVK